LGRRRGVGPVGKAGWGGKSRDLSFSPLPVNPRLKIGSNHPAWSSGPLVGASLALPSLVVLLLRTVCVGRCGPAAQVISPPQPISAWAISAKASRD
jgi:hypothetical protein